MKLISLQNTLLKNFNYTKFNILQVIKCHLVNRTKNINIKTRKTVLCCSEYLKTANYLSTLHDK